jgi:hypothetical protein
MPSLHQPALKRQPRQGRQASSARIKILRIVGWGDILASTCTSRSRGKLSWEGDGESITDALCLSVLFCSSSGARHRQVRGGIRQIQARSALQRGIAVGGRLTCSRAESVLNCMRLLASILQQAEGIKDARFQRLDAQTCRPSFPSWDTDGGMAIGRCSKAWSTGIWHVSNACTSSPQPESYLRFYDSDNLLSC